MDLTAQLHDELGFKKGEVIHIYDVIDSDFALGECNGRTGSFPLSFVEILDGNVHFNVKKDDKSKSKFRWWEEESSISDLAKFSQNLPNEEVNNEEVNNDLGRNVPITNSYKSENDKSHRQMDSYSSYTQENTKSHDSEVTAYGKTLFPFVAENMNELTLKCKIKLTFHSVMKGFRQ